MKKFRRFLSREFCIEFEFFTNESKIKLSDGHTEYKWIDTEELDKFEMRNGYKRSFIKYFNEKQS